MSSQTCPCGAGWCPWRVCGVCGGARPRELVLFVQAGVGGGAGARSRELSMVCLLVLTAGARPRELVLVVQAGVRGVLCGGSAGARPRVIVLNIFKNVVKHQFIPHDYEFRISITSKYMKNRDCEVAQIKSNPPVLIGLQNF